MDTGSPIRQVRRSLEGVSAGDASLHASTISRRVGYSCLVAAVPLAGVCGCQEDQPRGLSKTPCRCVPHATNQKRRIRSPQASPHTPGSAYTITSTTPNSVHFQRLRWCLTEHVPHTLPLPLSPLRSLASLSGELHNTRAPDPCPLPRRNRGYSRTMLPGLRTPPLGRST